MSHVKLGAVNDAQSRTVIHARGDFISFDSVFTADGGTGDIANKLTGLEGIGNNGGAGVSGIGGVPSSIREPLAAGPGVIGRGGRVDERHPGLLGAGVIGLGSNIGNPDPEFVAGVGVYGEGTIGVFGEGNGGQNEQRSHFDIGVVGLSGPPLFLLNPKVSSRVGVYGAAVGGTGVVGLAGGPIELGVRGPAGVVGDSGSGPGGSFGSSETGQLHLVPSARNALPTVGVRGDLWAHVGKKSAPGTKFRQGAVSLYICVQDSPDVRWQKVMLDTPKLKGGTVIP
jgi:hypothetical protein